MHSKFACHIGLRGKYFCRSCWVKGSDAQDGMNLPNNPDENTPENSPAPSVIHFSSFLQVHRGIIDSRQPKIQYPKETWNSRGVFLFSQHKLRASTSSSSRFVRRSTTWTPRGPCYIWLYGGLQSCQEQHLAYMLAYSVDSFNVPYLLPVHNF